MCTEIVAEAHAKKTFLLSSYLPPPHFSRQTSCITTCYTERRKTREREGSAQIAEAWRGGIEPKRTTTKKCGPLPSTEKFYKLI